MQRLLYLLMLLVVASYAEAQSTYTVVAGRTHPHELTVSLRLPQTSGQPRTLSLRGTAWGLKSQVHAPRCGARALRRVEQAKWLVPSNCRKVTWIVRPRVRQDGAADVSEQASLLFPQQPWWLLSEPTSLLRIEGENQTSTLGLAAGRFSAIGATPVGDGRWRVPSVNNAPEFFAFGNIATRTRAIGPFIIRYVADHPARVERLGLEAAHEKVFRYLSGVLPPPPALDSTERMLLVIWVGIDERHGRAGGSAGSRSFVANYVFGKPESEALNAAQTLTILAHEQFHQLADLLRGPLPPLPVWLGESLAHFYGLKALGVTASGPATEQVRSRFIDPSRPVTAGLLELERRHAANDPVAYPLLYEQGATFWAQVDEAIRESSSGTRSLDTFIPELLLSSIEQNGQLPKQFVAKLREEIGTRADTLINKYVGN